MHAHTHTHIHTSNLSNPHCIQQLFPVGNFTSGNILFGTFGLPDSYTKREVKLTLLTEKWTELKTICSRCEHSAFGICCLAPKHIPCFQWHGHQNRLETYAVEKSPLTKCVHVHKGKTEWKYQKKSIAGGLVCRLSGAQSTRLEWSVWGSCSTEKQVCTVFMN